MNKQERLQAAWDTRCRAKGYVPRGGMETRYVPGNDMALMAYYLLGGYGRVQDHPEYGWIAVQSVWGFTESTYQYVKLNEDGQPQ